MTAEQILWSFLIYGVIGWLWETPYVSFSEKRFVNRGFLRGPFIPIYGFAATTIMMFLNFYHAHMPLDTIGLVGIAILATALVASIWEYVTSFSMEVAFGARWWDYSDRKWNLNGRIAFVPSLFWGVGGFILWRFINPSLMDIVDGVFNPYKSGILWGCYTVLLTDMFFTLKELISLRKLIHKTQLLTERMVEFLDTKEPFYEWVNELKRNVKKKSVYQKLEGFMDVNSLQESIKLRFTGLKEQQEKVVEELTATINRFRKVERFSRNYPGAQTTKMPPLLEYFRKKFPKA